MCVFSSREITFEVLIRDQDLVMLGSNEDVVMLGFGDASCSSLRFGVSVTWVLRLRYLCVFLVRAIKCELLISDQDVVMLGFGETSWSS